MSFNMDDYVDVAERIRIFRDKHPDGSLQSEVTVHYNPDGFMVGVLCKAYAYRAADDAIPGIGHSYLQVPGKTPYTKDSEVENAETSAWGRAIVAALAADTKKVASSNEVLAKQEVSPGLGGQGGQAAGSSPLPTGSSAAKPFTPPAGVAANAATGEGGGWQWPFGKHKGVSLADTPLEYVMWYAEQGSKDDIRQKCNIFLAVPGGGFVDEEVDESEGIPF